MADGSRLRVLRGRAAVACWAFGMLVAAGITARTHFVADLSAFLPARPTLEQALLLDQISVGSATRLILIGIEGGTPAARADASRSMARELRASGAFESVANGDSEAWKSIGATLFSHRYLLSPAVDAQRFSVDGLREAIADSLALLGTPAGALIKPVLLRDPTGESVRLFESLAGGGGPRSEGGVWISRTAPRAVLVASTRADAANLDAQERAMQSVRRAFEPHAAQGLRLQMSGPGTFGVTTRSTIKAEVERLATAGTVIIVVLLWVALGSLRSLALALLPVASGVLAGIAAVSLGFGKVHGITLGFGTTLIGEAVDYAIYYMIQARPSNAALTARTARGDGGPAPALGSVGPVARQWIAASWPTVRLGLWTSVCGFAALLFSGFSGLAQLGTFSIAGLLTAALTTRFVFPHLAPNGSAGEGLRRELGRFAEHAVACLTRRVALVTCAALTLLAVTALALLPSPWRGDLAALSPIGADELRRDAQLRADLGTAEPGMLVVVTAGSEGEVLELAEAAGRQLDQLVRDAVLQGYESPARLLPSPQLQLARRAALPDAATLQARLVEATSDGPLPASRLGAFVDDVQAARSQPVLERAALQGTPLAGLLDAMLLPASGSRPWRALLSVRGNAQGIDAAALRAALGSIAAAQVLDVKGELDAMVRRYLRQTAWQGALGALAVVTLLALRLRHAGRLLRLCAPLAAASLIVVAGLAVAGVALGILHLVGLLLVTAIGSNYALFFDHLRHQPMPGSSDLDTLASLLLANLTTVLSFGLLALSSIAALHSIGQVVAPGALLSLLLSAAFISPRRP